MPAAPTWPFLNWVPQPSAVPYEDCHPPFRPFPGQPHYEKLRNEFDITTDDVEIQIFRTGEQLEGLPSLATSLVSYSVAQLEDAIPFIPFPCHGVDLRSNSLQVETEFGAELVDEQMLGTHTHTLFLNHRINLNVLAELRPLINTTEPIPVLVVFTYTDGDTPITRTCWLGNFVQFNEASFDGRVVMTSVVQCFYGEVWGAPSLETPQDLYRRLAIQAALYAEHTADLDSDDVDEDDDA